MCISFVRANELTVCVFISKRTELGIVSRVHDDHARRRDEQALGRVLALEFIHCSRIIRLRAFCGDRGNIYLLIF